MSYMPNGEIRFIEDEYIEFSNFDALYESFVNGIDLEDENNSCISNKFLLATLVGCIEGNIEIDIRNNAWHMWLGKNKVSSKLAGDFKSKYMLFTICEFVKENVEIYDFIIKYFNLWHKLNKNDNSEFFYDKYHILDLQRNFQQLIVIINEDINKAKNIMDVCIIEPYKSLYSTLILTFCNPILKHS